MELGVMDDMKFRFQSQKALLTYRSHIDKDSMLAFLTSVNKGVIPKKCYIAHENGANDPITPYEHTHVVVDFGKALDKNSSRFLDYNGIHPHISKVTDMRSWKKACKYITKEDKTVVLSNDDEFKDAGSVTHVWKSKTLTEALENTTEMRDVLATIALYKHKPMEWVGEMCYIKSEEMFLPWQKQVWDYIHTKPNDRKVYWIFDHVGNNGKTQFMKYCAINKPEKIMWLEPNGTVRDMLHVINSNIMNNGWRGDTFIINLARSATTNSDMPHVYKLIENLKDGIIMSTKYEGGQLMMPSPHVIVMSNCEPDRSRLSHDRWEIGSITSNRELAPVTLNKEGASLGQWKTHA